MGNCCKKDSSIHFGGEDWTSATSESLLSNEESPFGYGNSKKGEEKEELIAKNHASFSSNNGTEVKIKISKKQLEELVKRASLEGLTIQEAIIQLMDVGDNRYEHQHQKSWRPALQSIPETEVN